MNTYARVVNNMAIDVVTDDPATLFHADIAAQFVAVPEGTRSGAILADGAWNAPHEFGPVLPASTETRVSPVEFKLLFTAQERVAIKESVDPIVADFFEIVNDTRLTFVDLALASTKEALQYLTDHQLLADGRMAEILTGIIR